MKKKLIPLPLLLLNMPMQSIAASNENNDDNIIVDNACIDIQERLNSERNRPVDIFSDEAIFARGFLNSLEFDRADCIYRKSDVVLSQDIGGPNNIQNIVRRDWGRIHAQCDGRLYVKKRRWHHNAPRFSGEVYEYYITEIVDPVIAISFKEEKPNSRLDALNRPEWVGSYYYKIILAGGYIKDKDHSQNQYFREVEDYNVELMTVGFEERVDGRIFYLGENPTSSLYQDGASYRFSCADKDENPLYTDVNAAPIARDSRNRDDNSNEYSQEINIVRSQIDRLTIKCNNSLIMVNKPSRFRLNRRVFLESFIQFDNDTVDFVIEKSTNSEEFFVRMKNDHDWRDVRIRESQEVFYNAWEQGRKDLNLFTVNIGYDNGSPYLIGVSGPSGEIDESYEMDCSKFENQ